MIPTEVERELIELADRLEALEAQERVINARLLTVVTPYLTSVSGCNAVIELLPAGYVRYKARQALDAINQGPAEGTTTP